MPSGLQPKSKATMSAGIELGLLGYRARRQKKLLVMSPGIEGDIFLHGLMLHSRRKGWS
jgi:hypothetical protein